MTSHRVIARWTGFCAACPSEQPLVLVSEGPHGVRAWLSGAGPEDRALSYACEVCGRTEHVPATEADDEAYDATLMRWPDWVEEPVVITTPAAPLPIVADDVFGLAALRMATAPVPVAPAPRRPGTVSVVTLPVQRVSATDLLRAAA